MGFTKLDEGIVFSSIMGEDDSVFKVFSIFLATCKSNGISPVSPVFISSITHKAIEEVMRCIGVLEAPDPLSRSTNDEGRRIRKVDGGYFVINYQKYRDFTYSDNPEAVRKRKQREERDILGHVPTCPDISGHSASASSSVFTSFNTIPIHLREPITAFVEHRKKLKRPMTEKAIDLTIKKVQKLYPSNNDKQVACINQAIERGWQGVFELKDDDKIDSQQIEQDAKFKENQRRLAKQEGRIYVE